MCLLPEENSFLQEHFLFLKDKRELWGWGEAKFSQESSNFNGHLKVHEGVTQHLLKIRPLTSISKLSKKPKNDPPKSLDHDAHFPTGDHGIKPYF